MDARGAGLLGQAGDMLFHLASGHHHQVGQLVHDDHDVGEVGVLQLLLGVHDKGYRIDDCLPPLDDLLQLLDDLGLGDGAQLLLLKGLAGQFPVVRLDVANTLVGNQPVAALHFVDRPLQGQGGLLGSITTGSSRWGMPSYMENSSILGSTMIMRTSWGVAV